MRQMLKLGAAALLALAWVQPSLAQEPGDLSVRQVEDLHPSEGNAPPLTTDVSPAVDGRQVVLRGVDGNVYELGPTIITEAHVVSAEPKTDGNGSWAVVVDLTPPAADRFATLTSQLACLRDRGEDIKSRLATVVDGVVVTAAVMQEPTEGAGGVECGTGITGGELAISTGSRAEAFELAESFGWVAELEESSPPWVPLTLVALIFLATGAVAFRRVKKPLGRPELGDDA